MARLSSFPALVAASLAITVYYCLSHYGLISKLTAGRNDNVNVATASEKGTIVPPELLGVVYNTTDFVNSHNIRPPFWGCESCSPRHNTWARRNIWGPCYPQHGPVKWSEEVAHYKTHQPSYMKNKNLGTKGKGKHKAPDRTDLANLCRPGFLIIGAGKCGTSSLYHYIVDHPRVLPAKEKQIHYFKYYASYPMQWYLKHFPTTKSFLASGALLTGEASPGYLPYPDVAHLIGQRMAGPRIIVVGREPIDRAYSSYKYNYVNPTLELLKKGRIHGISKGKTDAFYKSHMFSFEQMVRAELQHLRRCLAAPSGSAVVGARTAFGDELWARGEFQRRDQGGEPPLVDLDGHCYGKVVNGTVLRRQWAELKAVYPDKVIPNQNLHLTQSLIGRGLYALPLEWWYLNFPSSDIHFLCTEDLSDGSGDPLNELGQFLGLSGYNFSNSVMKGAYNVGGHKGYDKEVSWETIKNESTTNVTKKEIPLSAELRDELSEFLRPYNERLFALVGRRCNW